MANYNDVFGNFTVPPAEATYSRLTLTESGVLAWPSNFSGEVEGQHLATDILEVSTGVVGLQLALPPANEASVGQDLMIRNVGAESVEILDAEGNPLTTIAAGEAKYIYTTSNVTAAGEWSMFTYGTGTSGADAALLAGRGLQGATDNKIQVAASYRGLDSDYEIAEDDRGLLLNVTVGSLNLTTPDAVAMSPGFYCFLRNSSLGIAHITPFAGQSINGVASWSLSPGDSLVLMSTGTDWVTVGFGQDVDFTFTELVVNAASGDATLSSSDVSGRMIRVTGTATAPITLTMPSVDNIYFVSIENGVGSHTVTFKTSAVGAGVVVLNANEKTVLYSDGVNITIAVTTTVTSTLSLTDGGAAAPSLFFALDTNTGIYRKAADTIGFATGGSERMALSSTGLTLKTALPIAQGGTGATTAATALSNLGATKDSRQIIAGNGLTGGGTLEADRTLTLGTPGTLTTESTNSVTATSHTHAITFPVASGTVSGIIELATNAEVQTGTDGVRAVTPAGLASRTATETRTGIIELATSAEVQAGSDTARAVTPAGLASRTATTTRAGLVELATNTEATTGVDTARAVTPANVKAVIKTVFPINSIYITATNINPETFIGGTWSQIAEGRTLIGVGMFGTDIYDAGDTGGTARVALSRTHMPSHDHGGSTGIQSANHSHSATTSSSGAHTHSTPLDDGGAFAYAGGGGAPGTNRPLGEDGTTSSAGAHTHTVTVGNNDASHTHSIASEGGGVAHENRMPYLAVYFWKRTA